MKQCYYQLLEIDRKATAAEIKTSYRKLALKFHPDKNPTEQGKQKFLAISQAYQVLSDPNERTWYDNNRQKILFNKDDMTKQDVQMYSFGFNIWPYFTSSCYKGFDDSEGGFYYVYRDIFEKIKTEEAKAFAGRQDMQQQLRKYEGFGDSTTNIKRVLQFYEDWENFTTYKTFVWVDDWDTREAPNRYVKREMQKQNKKQRQKQKKNYIKTIKDLISFLKKRDPRYRQYLIEQKKKEEQRQLAKKQKQQQKKKDKQQMKKIRQQMQEQRFKQIQQYHKKQNLNSQVNKHHVQSQDDADFYCPICQKQFKSQNQLRNHENSKMHKQALKNLQKQVMSKQQLIQQVKTQVEKQQVVKQQPKKKKNKKKKKNNNAENVQDQKSDEQQQVKKQQPKKQVKKEQPKKQIPKEQPKQKEPANKNKQNKQQNKKKQSSEQQNEVPINKKQNKKQTKDTKQSNNKNNNKANNETKDNKQANKKQVKKVQSDSDDTDAFMNAMLNKKKPAAKLVQEDEIKVQKKAGKQNNKKLEESQSQQSDQQGQRKKGKAKLKKEKKLANKQKQTGHKCNVCSESFPSKTKLFQHLNKTGHAKAK